MSAKIKDRRRSAELRAEGNALFKKADLPAALAAYNRALSHAPVQSKEYAYSLGNRSAVLAQVISFEKVYAN